MTKYFENFPTITYNGRKVRDITRRNNFTTSVSSNPYVYLPYTIKENERAEEIAQFYYGSVDYVWLIYMANKIVDTYHEWPLSEYDFNQYLIKKYQETSGEVGEDVVVWTQDPENIDNVIYYYREV